MKLETRNNNMSHEEFVKQLMLLLPDEGALSIREYIELIPQAEENAKLNVGTQTRCTVKKR